MALVGSYVGLSKGLVAVFPIFLLAWLRFAIAATALVPWTRADIGDAPLTARTRRLLFWESFLGNFLFSIFMLFGIRYSTALAAGVIMAALPAAVAVMSLVFLRERVEPRVWIGVVCAVGGIALVSVVKPGQDGDGSWFGNALLLGAVICEASYVIIGKQLIGSVSPKRITALVNLWGLVLVTPLGLWQAWHFDFSTVPMPTWFLLLFYSLAASVWTVWLWMTGLKQVPASRAGVFTVMLPITAAAVGVVWLGERIGAAQGVAFALALSGVVLATWPGRR